MSALRWGVPLLLPTVGALLLAGCDFESQAAAAPGSPAPDYQATTLEGETVALEDLRDQVVLLNLWATWCPPCRWEMPHLQALHEEFHDRGLRVVGVSVDAAGADRGVRRFLDDLGIDFLILRDPAERATRAFQAYGLPVTVLIDGGGMIRWRHMGPVTSDDPDLREILSETLDALPAS